MNEETSHYREFILFYAILFFTCVIGIIELLPEFESLNSGFTWHWFSLTALYLGLLIGIFVCMFAGPRLYSRQNYFGHKVSDFLFQKRNGKIVWWIIVAFIIIVFGILYLVKIQLVT